MRRGGKAIGTAAMISLAACGGEQGKLQIRATPTPLVAGNTPVPLRIAEAQGHFALGNVALALEAFRKALRDDPTSIGAMTGVAACYDRMARFDLSRRHYEAALAIAPRDPQLLTAFAASLDLQGRKAEAASVRTEIQQRAAVASATASPPPAPVTPMARRTAAVAPQPRVVAEPRRPAAAPQPVAVKPAPVTAAVSAIAPNRAQLAEARPAPVAPPRPTAAPPVGRSVTMALPPARPAVQPQPAKPAVERPAVAAARPVTQKPAVAVAKPVIEQTAVAVAIPPARPVAKPPTPGPAVETGVTVALRPVRPMLEAPQARPAVANAVTVALPPARPVAEAAPAKPLAESTTQTARAEPALANATMAAKSGPRLERTSLREVALITAAAPKWKALAVKRTERSTTLKFVPVHHATLRLSGVRILNAARVNKLAARTRSYLVGRGWSPMIIGDAPAVRSRSIIYYPPERRRTAQNLSAQFGFVIAQRPGTRQITVLLGRDAARIAALRAEA